MQDPHAGFRMFLRVIELGSIRAVARESGLEPSSVSRSLSNLEARLSTKLLERAQGRTRPTDTGLAYYTRLRQLLAQFDGLEAEVRGEKDVPQGLLRVNASIDFGQQHVADWLLDFKQLHPAVDVELTLSARRIDLVAQGLDVAIRIGRQSDSSLMIRKLADNHRVVVAAPSYLEKRGTPQTPADLEEHDHIFFLPGNRQQSQILRDRDGQAHTVQRTGGITIDAIMAVVGAVKRGFGIHTGPRWAFHDALEKGEVVELLPDYEVEPMPMYIVWAPAVFVPARIRAFIDFVAEKVRHVPGL